MSLLAVDDLAVRYEGTVALDGVSLRVARGETLALLGRSGSGKSTLAMAVAGLLPDTAELAGRVRVGGRDPLATPGRAGVGTIFQEPATALNPALTIGRQVAEVLRAHGVRGRAARAARAAALLARVGLASVPPGRHPHALSGGQRQRVLVAMALAAGPALLVADEPTAALDPLAGAEIADLLNGLVREDGIGLLLVTHDLRLAARLADRVAVLDGGRVVEEGHTADHLRQPRSPALAAMVAAERPATLPSALPSLPLAAASGLARSYPASARLWERRRVPAVRDVSFRLRAGETLAVVGASGSGKTTLARLVLGLDRPDAGTLAIDGAGWTGGRDRALRARVQAVFQDPADSLDPAMTVGAIIAEPLGLATPPPTRADRLRRVGAALAEVGLPPDAAARRPHAFSGGQRQRIALARALVLRPDLLVLDEALSALDPELGAEMAGLLARLQAERDTAMLLVTHDLQLVRRLAHQMLVLRDGAMVEQGLAAEVLANPRHPYTAAWIAASPDLSAVLSRR